MLTRCASRCALCCVRSGVPVPTPAPHLPSSSLKDAAAPAAPDTSRDGMCAALAHRTEVNVKNRQDQSTRDRHQGEEEPQIEGQPREGAPPNQGKRVDDEPHSHPLSPVSEGSERGSVSDGSVHEDESKSASELPVSLQGSSAAANPANWGEDNGAAVSVVPAAAHAVGSHDQSQAEDDGAGAAAAEPKAGKKSKRKSKDAPAEESNWSGHTATLRAASRMPHAPVHLIPSVVFSGQAGCCGLQGGARQAHRRAILQRLGGEAQAAARRQQSRSDDFAVGVSHQRANG